ncbi:MULTISPECIES: Maf family protein [Marinobacter]|uniref:7-methyl-GTP pyrophosphatase n=1 Tax=Marinobacter xiaoshiensis TaxID=3073652 RepID=A0ABU2HF31_9GAMM|nr:MULTISPECIES: Maf family nucleotide pyrophosphatase [unclassified Marinobacter]MBK1871978.1 septum formation inhibitor Maf [Marinobacter sp. 1-3A]MDS1309685.1 Maf family nucleotide pyrophosphatase [Marinobacter sp. F60267]
MPQKHLLLASSSPYRRELLARLRLPFTCASPNINESPAPGEDPVALARRLAESKSRALAPIYPSHWIIGSDQVAALPSGALLSKPGNYSTAFRQLEQCSNKSVNFHTGLALLDSDSGNLQIACEQFTVHFRELSAKEIDAYLRKEEPYDCAGSFKMEGMGITLFRELQGRDPNSLVGLPLIALNEMLIAWGRNPLLESR